MGNSPQAPFTNEPVKDNTKKAKPFYKQVWFWIIVAIAVMVLGSIGGAQNGNKPSATTTQSSTTNDSKSKQQVKPKAEKKLTGIQAVYSGDQSNGKTIDGSTGITVKATYDDGSVEPLSTGWTLENPGQINMDNPTVFTVSYNGFKTNFDVTATPPVEYSSALIKAQRYSDMMHMSKQGVYEQLTSEYGEQFSQEAAQYAVNHIKADWNANALAKAKSYQKEMSMSPAAIQDQLTSEYGEKFTPDEAAYAIQHLND